jgi:hypothetical protein
MPKLRLVILTAITIWAGIEDSQPATAAQFSALQMLPTNYPTGIVKDFRYFTLAKKCTIKRYRRPR